MKPQNKIKEKDGKRYFYRFSLNQRFQHITMASCVIALILTGMPLKFKEAFWAPYLYNLFGGIHVAPIVHKVAGSTLLLCLPTILFMYLSRSCKIILCPSSKRGSSARVM